MECKQRSKGRGRGVLALTSYEPCPRPSVATVGSWHRPNQTLEIGKQINKNTSEINCAIPPANNFVNDSTNRNVSTKDVRNNDYREMNGHCENYNNQDIPDTMSENNQQTDGHQYPLENSDMIAKYNYEAKPDKPGGFVELTIKQGEKLMLICKGHEETRNDMWWKVKNERGEQGFVPGTYCMILEKAPTALPWLENKRLLEEKEEKKREAELAAKGGTAFGAPAHGTPRIKEYQSAYTNNNNAPQMKNQAELSKQYYCEVCDKNLNGPQPYKSHMSSKAHREEVEYLQSKDQYN